MATAEFSKFAGILSVALSQNHLSGFEIAQLEFHHRSLGREDLPEEEMAIHSRILAWEIPWTEEPGGLQSMGSQRVRQD